MQINILYGKEGAKEAKGITVVVDIYRAASVASYALGQGARYIIPVATKEEALNLKKENPSYLLMGEEHGIFIEGFDFGNSPHEIMQQDLKDTVLIHRTTQGTQGLVNADSSDELIFGSFTTATAIARYIKEKQTDRVSIVAMEGKDSEDEVFAEYLKDLLSGKHPDKEYIKEYLRNHERSAHFLDPLLEEFPKEDIAYCLAIDHFNFVSLVQKEGDYLKIIKQEVNKD